jgi:hypothetical protein
MNRAAVKRILVREAAKTPCAVGSQIDAYVDLEAEGSVLLGRKAVLFGTAVTFEPEIIDYNDKLCYSLTRNGRIRIFRIY